MAYKLAPGSPIVQDTLGWILFSQGDIARARELLEQAARNSTAPDVHYHYGAVLAKSGDVAGARKALTAALSSKAGFPGKKAAAELLNSLEQGKK